MALTLKEYPTSFSGFRWMVAKCLTGIFEEQKKKLESESKDLEPVELFKAFSLFGHLMTNDYMKRKVRSGKGEKHKRALYTKYRVEILNGLFEWMQLTSEMDQHSIRLNYHRLIGHLDKNGLPKRK